MTDVYQQNGYDDRLDYLRTLADEYGDAVYPLADLMGPYEDFDGLISTLEDLYSD